MNDDQADQGTLAHHLNETRKRIRSLWLKLWGGGFLFFLIALGVAWLLIEPAPPAKIVIATGSRDGAYFQVGRKYKEFFRQHGVTLEVRETVGSLENLELLASDPEVDIAIVQGGTGTHASVEIESLASLYLEPVWVFYRGDDEFTDLRQLHGLRIGIGADGSGTQSIARLLLQETGVSDENSTLHPLGNTEARQALESGELDAAFFVNSPGSRLIGKLLRSDELRLMSFERSESWPRRHSFLSAVTLKAGVVDMERNLPPHDVRLIAPAANLVATTNLHKAFIPLLLEAATVNHEQGDSLSRAGEFPARTFLEFPLNESARRYFDSGPPFLQKYLPFWAASAVDRGKILLLPILTLMFPLVKIAPPLYRWRIRSRIYRWYRILREVEADLNNTGAADSLPKHELSLQQVQRELDDLDSVPLSYMEEFYNLRLHVEFVARRVDQRIAEDSTKSA